MRYLVVSLIVFVLSFLLFNKRRKENFLFGFVLMVVFLRFTIEKILPYEGTQIYFSFLRGGSVFFVAILLILYNKELTRLRYPWILLFSIVYIVFIGALREVAIQYLSLYTTLIVSCFFILAMFALKRRVNLTTEIIAKFCLNIGLFQAVLGVIQYFAPTSVIDLLTVKPYVIGSQGNVEIAYADLEVGSVVQGTFIRFNTFGNFMAFAFLLHLGYSIFYRSNSSIKNIFILMLFGFTVLLSGNRASLISMMIGAFVLIYFFRRKSFFWSLILISISYVFYGALIEQYIVHSSELTERNPFQRIISAFANLDKINSYEESKSTLALSFSLMPDFFKNIFFGGGEYFKRGYLIVGENSNFRLWDAALMTILTEFGVVGFTIFILPYLFFYQWVKKNVKDDLKLKIIFAITIMFLLQTITDAGIFGFDSIYLFILFIFTCTIKYNQSGVMNETYR